MLCFAFDFFLTIAASLCFCPCIGSAKGALFSHACFHITKPAMQHLLQVFVAQLSVMCSYHQARHAV